MRRILLLVLAVSALAAQQPPDESNLPPEERRIPPGHYCKREGVPIGPRETRAHSCPCTMSCTVNGDGTVTEHEDSKCLSWCAKNGRKCTCHVEEPCPGSIAGNALMNMEGRVVAVKIR